MTDRLARALADLRPCGIVTQFGGWQADLSAAPRSLAARMAALRVPGVGLAVLDGDEILWAGGGKRAKGGRPVNARTRFQAASISKPIFALAVMRLVDAGRIDLDEDVNVYLTRWRVPSVGGWQPRVTLRQLLSHTAGATVHGFPGYAAEGPVPTLAEVLAGSKAANTPPVVIDVMPGTQQRYAGGGVSIAQMAIEDALGQSLPEIMREWVLDPLGMDRSGYEQPPADAWQAEAATAHDAAGVPIPGRWHVYPELAAAGLWTTPADLARLGADLIALLRGEPSKLGLQPKSLAAMLKPALADQRIGEEYIGLGWICRGAGDGFNFGHTGGNEGFMANMRLFPELGQGAVVMTNAMGGAMLWPEVLSAIGREYGWPSDPSRAASMPLALAGALVGDWRSERGFKVAITIAGGRLKLEVPGQPPIGLSACGEAEAFAEGLNLRLTAPSDGVLRWVQPGRAIRFARAED
jgi:CubicO group peptidase (beta-lactamase class C family)